MLFLISDERTVERTENSMFPYLKEHPQDESGQAPARTHSAVVLFCHFSGNFLSSFQFQFVYFDLSTTNLPEMKSK